jgi:hypothetical protein
LPALPGVGAGAGAERAGDDGDANTRAGECGTADAVIDGLGTEVSDVSSSESVTACPVYGLETQRACDLETKTQNPQHRQAGSQHEKNVFVFNWPACVPHLRPAGNGLSPTENRLRSCAKPPKVEVKGS